MATARARLDRTPRLLLALVAWTLFTQCGGGRGVLDRVGAPGEPGCPAGLKKCGPGCIEEDHGCCDGDGTAQCGSAGGGKALECRPNTAGTCSYMGGGIPSKYCCGNDLVVGSLDVPTDKTYDGEPGVFCGNVVVRPGNPCSNGGDTGATGLRTGGSASSGGGSGGGGGTGGTGGGSRSAASCGLPSSTSTPATGNCSTNADCSAFKSRHGCAGALCGSDRLCHCCRALCSGSNCQCTNCTSCGGTLEMCLQNTCVFKQGGKTSD